MEVHHADKAYRKRSLWLFAAIVVMCGLLLWQLQSWLQQLTEQLGSEDPDTVRHWIRRLLAGLGIGLAIPAVGLGMTLRELGLAARLQGRFPPAEWKTLRDVRILRDAPALRWARRVEAAGLAALTLAVLLLAWSVWAWWYFG